MTLAAPLAPASASAKASGLKPLAAGRGGAVVKGAGALAAYPAVPAPPPAGPAVAATKVDSFPDPNADGQAEPGDTVTYTVTITNTGDADASGVTFADAVDPNTTLVGGSVNTQPVTDPDAYAASGNIPISLAAPGVLANDRDPDTGGHTGLAVTKVQGAAGNVGVATLTAAAGRGGVKGSVTLNSDGSFTYEPPPGFEGADSFTYEASDGTLSDGPVTVTINISGMVWFIRNNAGGSLNRGTFGHPFTSIASFNAANAGTGAAPDPKSSDFIALRTGSGTYSETDGVNLRAQQKLIGEGVAFNTAFTAAADSGGAYTTFAGAAGGAPAINTTGGHGVDLSTNNTVRGLNVGGTPGNFKINGAAVGSPVINTVSLTGAGGAVNISTGGAFGSNVTFGTLESTSSPGANLNLVGVTGTLTVTSGGAGLAGSAASAAAVSVSGGSVSFTYTGNVSKANAGALVSASGGHSGSLTFQAGALSATAGTGFQFDNADGTYNFNGTTTLAGGDAGIDITNGSSGAFNFSANTSITSPSGAAFNVASNPGSPSVTYAGAITQNTSGQRAVNVDGTTGGSIGLNTVTAGSAAGGAGNTGVNINNAAGSVSFTTLNLGTAGTRMTQQAVTIAGGAGAKSLGAVSIFTTGAAEGIHAANSTGPISTSGGTVDAAGAAAVNIAGAASNNRTPLNVQLTKVNASGGANGVVLQNTSSTGSPGGFHVLGTGGSCTIAAPTCTGGTIVGPSSSGLSLSSASSVVLTRMRVRNSGSHGINATGASELTLNSCYLQSNGNGDDEDSLNAVNMAGALVIDATSFLGAAENLLRVNNNNANLSLTVRNGSWFEYPNPKNSAFANSAILVQLQGSSVVNAAVQGNTFRNIPNNSLNFGGDASATGSSTATFSNNDLSVDAGLNVLCASNSECRVGHLSVGGSGGTINFIATENTFTRVNGDGVFIMGANMAATLKALVQNNTISNALDDAFVIGLGQNAREILVFNGNTISNIGGDAFEVASGETNSSFGTGGASDMDLVITNNTMTNVGQTSSLAATGGPGVFRFGDADQELCLAFTGNSVSGNGVAGTDAYLDGNFGVLGGSIRYEGAGSGAVNAARVHTDNPGIAQAKIVVSAVTLSNGAQCQRPGLVAPSVPSTLSRATAVPAGLVERPSEVRPSLGTRQGTPVGKPSAVLSRAVAAPKTAAPGALKSGVKRSGGLVYRYAASDTSAPLNPGPTPPAAQRRKVTAPVLSAAPGDPSGAGGAVAVNVGTLKPGDSVAVTFQVKVDSPYSGPANVSNQGRVTGSNFTTVNGVPTTQDNTDDPDQAGASDPTLTPVNSVKVVLNDARAAEPSSGTADLTFAVSLSQPAGVAVSVSFQTADGTATAGTCGDPGADYVAAGGQVSFAAGEQVKTINVSVCSDSVADDGETLLINLSNATGGAAIADGQAEGTITGNTPGGLLLSELRTSGPGGAGDDFVEVYNNSDSPHAVAAADSSGGYGLFKMGAGCDSTPVLVGTIPNGTVIPARGHYLLVGGQYSLKDYGGTDGAKGDRALTSDLGSDGNVGLFSTSDVTKVSTANRLDAVGFGLNAGNACDLLREGSTLPPVSGSTAEYSFFRDMRQAAAGNPKDTNDNAADFLFADTQATVIAGIPRQLGAPGPENLSSPVRRDTSGAGLALLDATKPASAAPNRSRSLTLDAPNNSTFGTLTIRRRLVNDTGGDVSRLRFRIVEMTTLPGPPGTADLRARTGFVETSATIGMVDDPATCGAKSPPESAPCGVTVQATTLESLPAQLGGGGMNSTLSAGTITLATKLPDGGSLNVNFLLGIQQTGRFRFLIVIEALP